MAFSTVNDFSKVINLDTRKNEGHLSRQIGHF